MSDMPIFIALASTVSYSGSASFSLPYTTQGLNLALRAYILSNATTPNRWRVTGYTHLAREQVQSSAPGSGGCACILVLTTFVWADMVGIFAVKVPCEPFHYLLRVILI